MGRPMTAADRTPEVGDVVHHDLCGAPAVVVSPIVQTIDGSIDVAVVTGPLQVSHQTMPRNSKTRYISRADGGPVMVED